MLSLMLMITRDINSTDRSIFNRAAGHPLQAYEWGEFRQKTRLKVVRKGVFEGKKLTLPLSVTIHPLPGGYTLGYFPKGPMPDETQLEVLKSIGRENNSILIKLEPNVGSAVTDNPIASHAWESMNQFFRTRGANPARPLFTRHTWQLNLKPSLEELLKNMHPKTRYNIKLAERKGVKIIADNSQAAFDWFVKLLFEETVVRQIGRASCRERV